MSYQLEALGDERFQQLCQAILVHAYPNVQCLPVGQRDGGRDAFSRSRREKGKKHRTNDRLIIFQVKYVRIPESRESRDLIEGVIKSEKAKVDRLIQGGASAYYLLTNVAGTSFPEYGSIDKVNAELSAAFRIDAYCWWRDDIERRIDAHSSIKWSYPDILRASDLLEGLMEGHTRPDETRRMSALKGYMAHQARYDEQLKFKQIDLQKSIIDLFVDVPAKVQFSEDGRRYLQITLTKSGSPDSQIVETTTDSGELELLADEIPDQDRGALQMLANPEFARRFPKLVVEGAPGQGKSTITQYLCLLHRLLLLNRQTDLARAESTYRPSEARIPFRVDVRDYALWITGRDPFGDDPSARLPPGTNRLLECFLAAQVQRCTGAYFTVDDLTAVTMRSQVLVVLDGFDEVADVATRNQIVKEVSDAAERIAANALSAQIIVTSRPAAFANSPGFPRDHWPHMQILSLSNRAIQTYAEKWLDGRGVERRDKREIMGELREKLHQTHVRDLARSPMQLAILLALVSVQGSSLPDRRTALYDQYINIFLNREAEKSPLVRDHRELLVHIHQHLAWILQVDAEANSGPGRMAELRLREEVRTFLTHRGHPTILADQLFSGMIERVVALVSRVQGTYEFEVQPLREYFAARYLRDTAPYDPPGTPRRGTLLERFDAVARNFYWLNVARFLAGCYGSGELPSLLFGLREIAESEGFKYISHISQLSVALLSDYVFNQQPKLALDLASRVTQAHALRLLLANQQDRLADSPLTLPALPARYLLVDACKQLVSRDSPVDVIVAACESLVANCTGSEIIEYWTSLRDTLQNDWRWLWLGPRLSVFPLMSLSDCEPLYNIHRKLVTKELVTLDRFEFFDNHPRGWEQFVEDSLDDPDTLGPAVRHQSELVGKALQALCLAAVFSEHTYSDISEAQGNLPIYRAVTSRVIGAFVEHQIAHPLSEVDDTDLVAPRELLAALIEFLNTRIEIATGSISPWSCMIEAARSVWGDRLALYRMAITANAISSSQAVQTVQTYAECSLTERELPLCDRAAYSMQARGNQEWWRRELVRAKNVEKSLRQFVLLSLFRLATVQCTVELSDTIGDILDELPQTLWYELTKSVRRFRSRSRRSRDQFPLEIETLPKSVSPRLACLLISRLNVASRRAVYEQFLVGYRGTDRVILGTIMDTVLEWASTEHGRWAAALPVVAYAYAHHAIDTTALYRISGRRGTQSIPLDIAHSVCENPTAYPLRLVSIAEARLARQTGEEAIPVGKIAARDQWFTDD